MEIAPFSRGTLHPDAATGMVEFNGVGDQVAQDGLQHIFVGMD